MMTKTHLVLGMLLAPTLAFAQAPAAPPVQPDPINITSAPEALAKAPKANISNGVIKATVLLPDGAKGFYRATRFDWAGIVSSLTYGGQEYYGLWFDQMAPNVRDFTFFNGKIVSGPNTAALGPVDAYDSNDPPGWKDAPAGGTFLKIGVGMLRKPTDGANYSSFRLYDIVNAGTWKVRTTRDSVEFVHTLTDPASGYGYVYRKVVRLAPGKPVMDIEHSLTNTGTKAFISNSFNHNFLTLGGAPTGPGLTVKTPYAIVPPAPIGDAATISGSTLTYRRALVGQERFSTGIGGFTPGQGPYDVSIHNAKGAGYRVASDYPMDRLTLWSVPVTVAAEPFIKLDSAPGKTLTWTFQYTYAKASAGTTAD
jgi:hypothetical protein